MSANMSTYSGSTQASPNSQGLVRGLSCAVVFAATFFGYNARAQTAPILTSPIISPISYRVADPAPQIELPPIFSQKYVANANSEALTQRMLVPKIERSPAVTIGVEATAQSFDSKSQAGKYVLDKTGLVALYATTPLGNKWTIGKESAVQSQISLRNGLEPGYELAMKNLAGSGFTFNVESRVTRPAEIKLYKRIKGGEEGIYCTLDKHGHAKALLLIRFSR